MLCQCSPTACTVYDKRTSYSSANELAVSMGNLKSCITVVSVPSNRAANGKGLLCVLMGTL